MFVYLVRYTLARLCLKRILRGFFLPNFMKYTKKACTIDEHLEILINRGLTIDDTDRAKRYLESVSYYRLSGYMFHLQDKGNASIFYEGTTFNDIINLYTFDKKLRCIFLEYLERIEVCLRTRILNAYSELKGFYWSIQRENFLEKKDLRDNGNEVLGYHTYVLESVIIDFEKPKEQFLKAFKLKYTDETYPPENMYFETLSFGKLIKLYACLKNDNTKNSIATAFKLPSGKTLVNWLLFLNDVRNVCAHHSRLWNRKFTANKLIFPSRKDHKIEGAILEASNSNIYGAIIAIHHLLLTFNTNSSFIGKLEALIELHSINVRNLGFPQNWKDEAPWRIKN